MIAREYAVILYHGSAYSVYSVQHSGSTKIAVDLLISKYRNSFNHVRDRINYSFMWRSFGWLALVGPRLIKSGKLCAHIHGKHDYLHHNIHIPYLLEIVCVNVRVFFIFFLIYVARFNSLLLLLLRLVVELLISDFAFYMNFFFLQLPLSLSLVHFIHPFPKLMLLVFILTRCVFFPRLLYRKHRLIIL